MNLKVATYNVWSGRNNVEPQTRNYDLTAEVILQIAPDIIGLQEVGKHPCSGFDAYDIKEEVSDYLGKKTLCHKRRHKRNYTLNRFICLIWNTKGDANEKRISFSDDKIYSVFYISRCSAGDIIYGI